MTLSELLAQLNQRPVDFKAVMQVIEAEYTFIPSHFTNGNLVNLANTNNGSCKIFAFGLLNQLSKQATLNAFGDFYTQDVLQNPEGLDHQNIRNFMQSGWAGISYSSPALQKK
ncbi:MAG: HopJ type III effector protein [Pseudomonadaceae bacterium]|nr:HopJ type III effector protein [Pseudomonadaceae bacterium]